MRSGSDLVNRNASEVLFLQLVAHLLYLRLHNTEASSLSWLVLNVKAQPSLKIIDSDHSLVGEDCLTV
jgi:hypothetical protein